MSDTIQLPPPLPPLPPALLNPAVSPSRTQSHLRKPAVALLAIGAVTGCILLHFYPPATLHLPPCAFYRLTGIYCPGCGAARALHHLMQGDLLGALHCNLFFVIALPFLVYFFSRKALRLFGLPLAPDPRLSSRASWILTTIVVAWWIVRNLPIPWFHIPPA